MSGHFTVEFCNADAEKEYQRLDGSVKKLINIGLKKLETRADEIGRQLEGELHACKELKYRKLGIRVIFRISNSVVELVDIIAIGERSESEVFKIAQKRLDAERR